MKLTILGIRGIPAAHGGFETFAECLALYLVSKGWQVVVYCQENGKGPIREDDWRGVKRAIVPVSREGAMGTIEFDWRCISHLVRQTDPGLVLTLGYNTALFCVRLRAAGILNIINMDGLEWKRDKWRYHERAWLWLNERCGCWFGNHLVADHPEIANHLATRVDRQKITMIPYGGTEVLDADLTKLASVGVSADSFVTVIARPEPENSIREIVRAFSRKRRGIYLIMLGRYEPEKNSFHKAVLDVASPEVIFPGAIYDQSVVQALRYFGRAYLHGHRVGGTNPSLVEALGAGSAVIAHDNPFNRWVAGDTAAFFRDEDTCAALLDRLLGDDNILKQMRKSSLERFRMRFTWSQVFSEYENLFAEMAKRKRIYPSNNCG